MADKIPTQNTLIDVIKASAKLLEDVRNTISKHKKETKKSDSKPDDDLKKLKTDLQAVFDFVKDINETKKKISNVVDELVVVLGMPGDINKRLGAVKVEIIDSKNLQHAVDQLKRVLNTPAGINEALNIDVPTLKGMHLRIALRRIIFMCELPKLINDRLAKIKVEDIDDKQLKKVKTSLETVFGKKGILYEVEKTITQINTFKGLGIIKFMAVWTTIHEIQILTNQVSAYSKRAALMTSGAKPAIAAVGMLNKFMAEFVKVLTEIDKLNFRVFIVAPLKIKETGKLLRRIENLFQDMLFMSKYLVFSAIISTTAMLINKTMGTIVEIISTIKKFNIATLVVVEINVRIIARVMRAISHKLLPALEGLLPFSLTAALLMISLKMVGKMVGQFVDIIKTLDQFNIAKLIIEILKVKLLAKVAKQIRKLIHSVSLIGEVALVYAAVAIPGLAFANIIVYLFSGIIKTIAKTKFGLLFNVKVRRMISATRVIRRLIRGIANMVSVKTAAKATVAAKLTNMVIKSFSHIILNILLLTPLMALFILMSPLIIVVFLGFAMVFKIIVRILAKIVNPKIVIVIAATTGVIMMLAILGLSLVVLALVSIVIVENALNIILFFGIVAAVAIGLGLIGLLLSKISPLLMSAIYGIGIVALAVFAVLAIAAMLWLLSKIELDQEAIKENVKKVMSTVLFIITCLFEDELNDPESKDSVFTRILKVLGGAVAKIIMALATCAILVATFVSVACILMIAAMLRVLQNLKLDQAKILANVDIVFDTVDKILARFMQDGPESKKSNRGILLTVMSWINPGMAKVYEALMTMAYLFLMFVSVALVLGIAAMLRVLQNLNLNTQKIEENVDTLFDTVDQIISRIFGDRDDKKHPSNRGILVTIISWVDPGLAKIVEAALSIVYLMLMLVAITIVLGIAALLRQIQDMDLDSEAINAQVDEVFNVVDHIINRVFAPADDDLVPGHGFLGKIIGFFMPGLAKIIDALMAVAQLSLIFLAISIVKGIAENLNEIAQIDLKESDIMAKVDTIFKICGNIMKQIYEKADTMLPEPENKGLFSSIISFFSPDLGAILDALTTIAKLAVVQTAISAIAGIGKALKQIQDLDVNLDQASAKTDKILEMAESLCTKIFSRESKIKFPVPEPEKQSVFGALISWAFGGKSDEDRALEAAMKRVEVLGVIEAAVGALGNILEGTKRILDMNVADLTRAKTKVDDVMNMAAELSQSIFGSDVKITLPEPSDDEVGQALVELGLDHWWRSANAGEIADAKVQASMKFAMRRVEVLGLIASAVGSIASIIDGIDKIKTYEIPDLNDIQQKVQQVMQASSSISFIIFNQDNIGQSGGNTSGIKAQIEEVQARIDFAKAGAEGVAQLSTSLNDLIEKTKFDEQTVLTTKNRISAGVSAIGEIMSQIDAIRPEAGGDTIERNCELMDRISKTVDSFVQVTDKDVKNAKDITENYIKFFKQVDSMDIQKLRHTDWLMRSWASISRDLKGDFEGLAKTVNQHIMPMLDKVNKTLEETTKAQQEIIKVMSQPVDINGVGSTGGSSLDNFNSSTPNINGDAGGTVDQTGRADGGSGVGGGMGNIGSGTAKSTPNARINGKSTNPADLKTGKKYVVSFAEIKDA